MLKRITERVKLPNGQCLPFTSIVLKKLLLKKNIIWVAIIIEWIIRVIFFAIIRSKFVPRIAMTKITHYLVGSMVQRIIVLS